VRPETAGRAERGFLAFYALAWAGSVIAYMPFLTLLLPVRIEWLAGNQAVGWLALITLLGAVASSLSNIAFGWLSDLSGRRRPWVLGGLAVSSTLLLAAPRVESLWGLCALVVAWQAGVNMMIGPLSAWAGDQVPDGYKGLLGGLLALAPASGALAGALVTMPYFGPQIGIASAAASGFARHAVVVLLVAACLAPLLLFGKDGGFRPAVAAVRVERQVTQAWLGAMATRMWLARLMVQISEALLFAYLYLWLRSVDPMLGPAGIARVLTLAVVLGAPSALLAGRWADRHGRPVAPLVASALVAALALVGMGLSQTPAQALASYLGLGVATSVFLALHSAQTLRVLPDGARRGRNLGLFNLTNTLPSLLTPALTVMLVPRIGFSGLFHLLAVLALGAAALLVRWPRHDRKTMA
jgi:MFS family permease